MSSGLDIGRRFNSMQDAVKKSLYTLVNEYAEDNLYSYDGGGIASRLGTTEENTLSIIQSLLNHDFLSKVGSAYRLNRQRADTLITLGLLDTENNTVSPMEPASNDEELMYERDLSLYIENALDDIEGIDPLGQEEPEELEHKDDIYHPARMSTQDFKMDIDQPGKNKRLRLIEIVDMSTAGRRISPPMWIVSDTKVNKLYLIAQDGLGFQDPDQSYYVGLKQLLFLKQNPCFILGSFPDNEQGEDEARLHASRFFDTTANSVNVPGYYPRKVGEKFWVVQSAKNGKYHVLKKGLAPAFTLDKNKVEDLTFGEAMGVFNASEAKAAAAKEKSTDKYDSEDEIGNVMDYNTPTADFINNLDHSFEDL